MFMSSLESGMFSSMGDKSEFANFYRNLSSQYQTPKAIIIISAHWEEKKFTVNCHKGQSNVPLLYDYSGFPQHLYSPHFLYPAVSNEALENRVYNLISEEFGVNEVRKSSSPRGFDHGVFIPLKVIYPEANIPIIQVSLTTDLDFNKHYRLGKSLSTLLSENIMIIGSGQTTHNLRGIGMNSLNTSANRYCQWLSDTLLKAHEDPVNSKHQLINMMSNEDAEHMHPRTEHIIPLIVAFGAAFPNVDDKEICLKQRVKKIYSEIVLETLSLDSYQFNDVN